MRATEELRLRFACRKQPPSSLLDVGCGNGVFLRVARTNGYDVEGIDISRTAASLASEQGFRAVAGDFLTHTFDRQFDIITMWDVVEHLTDPLGFLSRARQLLNPGGFVFAKVPCFGASNFLLIRRCNRLAVLLLAAPAHIQYFTENSLLQLATNAGFGPSEVIRAGAFRSPSTGGSSLGKKAVGICVQKLRLVLGNYNALLYANK